MSDCALQALYYDQIPSKFWKTKVSHDLQTVLWVIPIQKTYSREWMDDNKQ